MDYRKYFIFIHCIFQLIIKKAGDKKSPNFFIHPLFTYSPATATFTTSGCSTTHSPQNTTCFLTILSYETKYSTALFLLLVVVMFPIISKKFLKVYRGRQEKSTNVRLLFVLFLSLLFYFHQMFWNANSFLTIFRPNLDVLSIPFSPYMQFL